VVQIKPSDSPWPHPARTVGFLGPDLDGSGEGGFSGLKRDAVDSRRHASAALLLGCGPAAEPRPPRCIRLEIPFDPVQPPGPGPGQ
jgi:hypothetical protein